MNRRILILEPDEQVGSRLLQALQADNGGVVSLVPTMREACLLLAQQPHDLALIPRPDSENLIRSLRALQPDLRLVLTSAAAADARDGLPEIDYQGLLVTSQLEELPLVLEQAWQRESQPAVMDQAAQPFLVDEPMLAHLCQEAFGEERVRKRLLLIVFAREGNLIAHCGSLSARQAQAAAEAAARSWVAADRPDAQLEFAHLPELYDSVPVFTRQVAGGRLLSLASRSETTLTELRQLSEYLIGRIAALIVRQGIAPQNGSAVSVSEPAALAESTYAIAWRPVRLLPAALQSPIRMSLSQIAHANECKLLYIAVGAGLIHMVVNCPPDRNSAWAAHLFKEGSEKDMQEQFGVTSEIWAPGYHAVESDEPLSATELSLLQQRAKDSK